MERINILYSMAASNRFRQTVPLKTVLVSGLFDKKEEIPFMQEDRPTRQHDLANFFGLKEEESAGGILGLFETISKLHSDTGNNFSVTRRQTGLNNKNSEEKENGKLPGIIY